MIKYLRYIELEYMYINNVDFDYDLLFFIVIYYFLKITLNWCR